MRKLLCLALLVGSLFIAMTSVAHAAPFGGQITRANATANWTRGHLTFTLNWNGPECFVGYRCIWSARATVQPALPSYPWDVEPFSDPNDLTVWSQDLDDQPPQTFNVDLPNAEILPGAQGQRLCLFGERGHWRDGCPLPCIIYPTRYIVDERLLQGAPPKRCRPVRNPYPNTRYEGVDLTRIRAVGVKCDRARRVARRAHKKGLRMTPPSSGILHYRWRRWNVRGDLRPSHDRFRARHRANRVRWRF